MNLKFFDLAAKVSKLSTHSKHAMGAVLVRKNRVVSVGSNQNKTHTRSNTPYKHIHCEFSAILNSKLDDFSDCSIYITRVTPGGKLGLSYPCAHCLKMLKSLDIKTVYYTDSNVYKVVKL